MIGSYLANHIRYTEQSLWWFVWLPSLCYTDFWRNPWALACIANIWFASVGVDIGFLVGWGVSPWGVPTYKLAGFSQKLHEIKKILVRGGWPPWICHWSVVDPRGQSRCAPPMDQKFSWCHSVFGKIWQIWMMAPPKVWCPFLRQILDPPLSVWKDTNKILNRNVCLQIVRKICVVLRPLEFSLKITVECIECLEFVLNVCSGRSRIFPQGLRQLPKLLLFFKFLPKTA